MIFSASLLVKSFQRPCSNNSLSLINHEVHGLVNSHSYSHSDVINEFNDVKSREFGREPNSDSGLDLVKDHQLESSGIPSPIQHNCGLPICIEEAGLVNLRSFLAENQKGDNLQASGSSTASLHIAAYSSFTNPVSHSFCGLSLDAQASRESDSSLSLGDLSGDMHVQQVSSAHDVSSWISLDACASRDEDSNLSLVDLVSRDEDSSGDILTQREVVVVLPGDKLTESEVMSTESPSSVAPFQSSTGVMNTETFVKRPTIPPDVVFEGKLICGWLTCFSVTQSFS